MLTRCLTSVPHLPCQEARFFSEVKRTSVLDEKVTAPSPPPVSVLCRQKSYTTQRPTQVHTQLVPSGGLHTPPHLNTEEAEAQKCPCLSLALAQQCGSQAGSDPPPRRPVKKAQVPPPAPKLTLQHIASYAPDSVCLKKPLGAGPHSHPSQSKNNRAACMQKRSPTG